MTRRPDDPILNARKILWESQRSPLNYALGAVGPLSADCYTFAMPNGGPDNCGTCGFNRRNHGVWRNAAPDEREPSFCEIRGIPLTADHWTYCWNWHTRSPQPIGPVYASGLYESAYRRIPWHGNVEPETAGPGVCSECGEQFADGIQIAAVESAAKQFCCNLHYLTWWKRQHPGEEARMSEGIGEH